MRLSKTEPINKERQMPKRTHRSLAEQVTDKSYGSPPFHYEKMPYQGNELMGTEDIQKMKAGDDNSIEPRLSSPNLEKGTVEPDNLRKQGEIQG
jgi:hypothetical protein